MEVRSSIRVTEKEIIKLGSTLEDIQKDLTLPNPEYSNIQRFGKRKSYSKIPSHLCYLKKIGSEYIIPRYYFETLPDSISDKTILGREILSEHTIVLRDYQNEFVTANKDTIKNKTGILINLPCGHGKTIMAIWLSFYHARQTLVLVPTYYLARQWASSLETYTNASYVILKSTDSEIPVDKDFTIVVMDLFSVRTLPNELVNNIGHVVLDEAHRIGAETYLPILEDIPAKYRTALTATFRRADGMHRILQYHFGTMIKMDNQFPRPFVYSLSTGVTVDNVVSKNKPYGEFINFLDLIHYDYHETKNVIQYKYSDSLRTYADDLVKSGSITKAAYREIVGCLKRGSEMSYSVVDSYLNEHSGRRKLTIKLIQQCLDAGRTVLFLSKRKDTLQALHKYFAGYKPLLVISETNERSDEEEKYLQSSCPLILGVTQLAKEGLDIPRLDTVIFHLPMKDTEQAMGRISRLFPDKKPAMGIYLRDDSPITWAVFTKAKKFFAINSDYKGDRKIQNIIL